MNELSGVSPQCFSTANELRLFLSTYGPHTGKYVLAYPSFTRWRNLILECYVNAGDIERERIKSALTTAVRSAAFIEKGNIPWVDSVEWLKNAVDTQTATKQFSQLFISDAEYDKLLREMREIEQYGICTIFESGLSGPVDELIETSPGAYLKNISILFSISHDIHLVDPYFNPLKRDRREIYSEFVLKTCSSTRPIKFRFWVRGEQMLDNAGEFNEELLLEITRGKMRANHPDTSMDFILLDDELSAEKLHARYFITEKGGVKFDQGFQKLPAGRRNVVSPMGKALHESIYKNFTKDNFSMKVRKRLKIL